MTESFPQAPKGLCGPLWEVGVECKGGAQRIARSALAIPLFFYFRDTILNSHWL